MTLAEIVSLLLKIGLPPAVVALCLALGWFDLPSLGQWHQGVMTGLKVLLTGAGAFLNHKLRLKAKTRLEMFFLSLAIAVASAFLYVWLIGHEPTHAEETRWSVGIYVTFTLSYFCFGFCMSAIIGALVPPAAAKK